MCTYLISLLLRKSRHRFYWSTWYLLLRAAGCIFLFDRRKTWILSTFSWPFFMLGVAHTVKEVLLCMCDYCFTAVIFHVGLGCAFCKDHNMMSIYLHILSGKINASKDVFVRGQSAAVSLTWISCVTRWIIAAQAALFMCQMSQKI